MKRLGIYFFYDEGRKKLKNIYDFIDLNLFGTQIAHASVQDFTTGVINCCSGEPVSLKDKVEEFIKTKSLKIKPEYGAFTSRKYDSPAIWGCAKKNNEIMGGK